jgi:hypothetical protein
MRVIGIGSRGTSTTQLTHGFLCWSAGVVCQNITRWFASLPFLFLQNSLMKYFSNSFAVHASSCGREGNMEEPGEAGERGLERSFLHLVN